jgi:hypothetical protein
MLDDDELDFGVAIGAGHDLLNMVISVLRDSATRRQQKNDSDRQDIGELQMLVPVSQALASSSRVLETGVDAGISSSSVRGSLMAWLEDSPPIHAAA